MNRDFSHFIKTPERFMISLEEMIAEQDHFKILVAEKDNEELVGFASTFIAWYSWIGKTLYMDDLFVIETHRSKGLGSWLIDEVFKLAKNQGCKKVKWQVSKWNQNAIDFYRNKGAIIDDVEINCDLIL
ncbi:MAG: GNAT family N-acetyltransferase [Cytophagales bacterium]|nr:GNAT family N-acetyltransferase [Cytophagales bacterium]